MRVGMIGEMLGIDLFHVLSFLFQLEGVLPYSKRRLPTDFLQLCSSLSPIVIIDKTIPTVSISVSVDWA